jgi:hypothetical protein
MKYLSTLLIILTTLFISSCTPSGYNKIIGIKIYDYHADYGSLASEWNEMGINTAFVSASLAANDTFRQALRKRDISVFIIFPVFQNPELLKQDSSLFAITSKGFRAKNDWVEFVCPSRRSYRVAKINELSDLIRSLDPDGISIDFIRQFVFWEMIYPEQDPATIERACYCDSCLADFSEHTGLAIPDSCKTTDVKAGWTDKNYPDLWSTFRCELITSMVKELADKARTLKPGIKTNLHAVPWREKEFDGANKKVAAQDLRQIAPYVDFISPMCYSQMLKRDATWIADVVDDMDKRATGKVLPSIQVYPYYIDRSFNNEDFKQCLEEAIKLPSRGVVFFSWPLFQKDSSRMEVVSGVLGRKTSPD